MSQDQLTYEAAGREAVLWTGAGQVVSEREWQTRIVEMMRTGRLHRRGAKLDRLGGIEKVPEHSSSVSNV